MKENLSLIEIENKVCQKCSISKPPVEVVYEKLMMNLDGIPTNLEHRPIHHPRFTAIKKGTFVFDDIFKHYFNDSLLHDVLCENCSQLENKSIKTTFTVSRHIKKPPTVLKILFQRTRYDTTQKAGSKNDLKVCLPFEYMIKHQSSNEKISYTLVSIVNHDGDSLNCGHYVSDVFDSSTGIWWHCDDDNISELSDIPEGVYYKKSDKPQ